MARDLTDATYRPMPGLQHLTFHQVRIIDAMIGSLRAFTNGGRDEKALLILEVSNGNLKSGYTTARGEKIYPNER